MLRPLPRTDEAYPDESVRGYALRMAEVNRVRGLAGTARLLGCESIVRGGVAHANAIAQLYGASPSRLVALAPEPVRRDGCLHFWFLGCEFSKSWLLRLQRPQVCPRCLAEHGYARADWDILFMTHCRLHGTPLLDQCPSCKEMLNWRRVTLRRCSCGRDLSTTAPPDASNPVGQGLAAWLSCQLRLPVGVALAAKPCGQWKRKLDALSVDGALLVLWALGAKRSADDNIDTGRTHGPIQTSEVMAIVQRAHERLGVIEAGPAALFREGRHPVHVSALAALAARGLTFGDRRTAASLLETLGLRRWKSASMRRHDPHSQLELFDFGPSRGEGTS